MNRTIRLILCAVLWSGWQVLAWSQTASPLVTEMEQEKQRIRLEKSQVEAAYEKSMLACRSRFAVVDCERDAQRLRRQQMESLKRQDMVMQDEDRKRKAGAQMAKTEERIRHQAEEEERGGKDSSSAGRSHSSEKKNPVSSRVSTQKNALGIRTRQQQEQETQARFDSRQQAAAQHKDKVLAHNRDKPSTAKALPVSASAMKE